VTNQGHVDHYREKYNNMTYEVKRMSRSNICYFGHFNPFLID